MWDDPDRPRPPALLARARPRDRRPRRSLPRGRGRRRDDRRHGRARATSRRGSPASTSRVGGSGDPSPVTAFGVVCAMRAGGARARRRAVAARSPRAVVQGVGPRRRASRRLLVADGRATSSVSRRVRRSRRRASCARHGVDGRARPTTRSASPCDVLAPCALGGVLDDAIDPAPAVPRGRRCGEQPARERRRRPSSSPRAACSYVPDFVANAGGIINIAEEFVGLRPRTARSSAPRRSRPTTTRVLAGRARARRHPAARRRGPRPRPHRARRAPAGRWEPGDPAAWTNGAPLTRSARPPVEPASLVVPTPRRRRLRVDGLAHVAGVAERVAAGLGPDGEAVRLRADRDLGDARPMMVSIA